MRGRGASLRKELDTLNCPRFRSMSPMIMSISLHRRTETDHACSSCSTTATLGPGAKKEKDAHNIRRSNSKPPYNGGLMRGAQREEAREV